MPRAGFNTARLPNILLFDCQIVILTVAFGVQKDNEGWDIEIYLIKIRLLEQHVLKVCSREQKKLLITNLWRSGKWLAH